MTDNPTTAQLDRVFTDLKGKSLSQKVVEDANSSVDGIMGKKYGAIKAATPAEAKDGLVKSQNAFLGARDHLFGTDLRDVTPAHPAKAGAVELSERDKDLIKLGFLSERSLSLSDNKPLTPAASSANLDRVFAALKGGQDVNQAVTSADALMTANYGATKVGLTEAQLKDLKTSQYAFLGARDHFFGTDPRDEQQGKSHKDGTVALTNSRDAQLIKLGFIAARELELADKK